MIRLIKNKLKNHFINNLSIPNCNKSLERIQKLGFRPQTVFDVGAYKGEFSKACLDLWKDVEVVCFEALKDKATELDNWSKTEQRIRVIAGLVGDEYNETVKFNEKETASSVLNEFECSDFDTGFHIMRTLDYCIEEYQLNVPSLLKIDTQGFEYQVIKGLLKNLDKVEVIIAELNHIDIHKDVKLAEEVIGLLYSKGFVIYDILEIHRRPSDNATWQTDFMFVKKDSFLRYSKKW